MDIYYSNLGKDENSEFFKMSKNITALPDNINHLVKTGDLQFLVPPDGACAPNSGAAHIFQDPKFGPQFRRIMNTHMADRWEFYKNKVSFPYIRQIGLKGKKVNFAVGEELKFCDFLRTSESEFLWSDSEDLQLMANLYQMKIKIITTKGENDQNPSVNFIGLDPGLKEHQLLPEGVVPEMVLLHYDQTHYNLIISKDSPLAMQGTLTDLLICDDNEFPEKMDVDTPDTENKSQTEGNLKTMKNKLIENQSLINNLKQKISLLEIELKKHKFCNLEELDMHMDEDAVK